MNALDRRAQLLAEIAARLRPLCAHMPVNDFDAMVADSTRVQPKFQGRATPTEFELAMFRRLEGVEQAIHRTAAERRS